MIRRRPVILFLNQSSGPLFRDLAEDVAAALGPSWLLTGSVVGVRPSASTHLRTIAGPSYDRQSDTSRLRSWTTFFFAALRQAWVTPSETLLFIVSNPPFLPLVGLICAVLRAQRYVVLVYDIYPDLLVNFDRLSADGLIARLWRRFNRMVWERSDAVFTIGTVMGRRLEEAFDVSRTRAGRVLVIENWSDVDRIAPVPKHENAFAQEHGQADRITVLYSGNLGETQDLDTLLAAAHRLRDDERVQFLIIGDGSKRSEIDNVVRDERLDNVTLLQPVPEERLAESLSTGDVALVPLARGAEGLSVPSKLYSALAAGSALLVSAAGDSEASRLVSDEACGVRVEPGDVDGMVNAVTSFASCTARLEEYRKRARALALARYSRQAATALYVRRLEGLGIGPRSGQSAGSSG